MRSLKKNNNSFSRVLEPTTQRYVTAEFVVSLDRKDMDNIQRIEYSPPKLGDTDFGKFKVTYKTPVFCEINR